MQILFSLKSNFKLFQYKINYISTNNIFCQQHLWYKYFHKNKINNFNYLYFHPTCSLNSTKEIQLSFTVIKNFINDEEEHNLLKDIEPHLKNLKYEFDHWDDVSYLFFFLR